MPSRLTVAVPITVSWAGNLLGTASCVPGSGIIIPDRVAAPVLKGLARPPIRKLNAAV